VYEAHEHLPRGQTAALDRLAEQEGVSRAELIRRLLDRVLPNTDESLAPDLEAIEASFGALRDSMYRCAVRMAAASILRASGATRRDPDRL
jgi:Ribbon-helix-helix protein, copG family